MAGERRSLPTYHFTSPTGEDCHPFDPNGAIFHRGRYHLGYIYQAGGRHSWGHVSSADLLRWCQHPPLLAPGPEGGIFSGNAFHDRRGRVVLAYHGLGDAATGYPAGNCLAVARDDDLDAFAKLAANPVMRDPGWDPHVWLDGDTCYAISGSNPREDRPAKTWHNSGRRDALRRSAGNRAGSRRRGLP